MLEDSAHLTLGDARCGSKEQDQFLQKSDNPDREGTHASLPKKSGHLQTGGATNHKGNREVLTLCSGQFVVPGAHDFDWVLGAPNCVQSVRSIELFKSARGTLRLKCHVIWCWISPGQIISFSPFFATLPHSRSELGYPNFL